jgi:ERCC4-type nuclease
MSDLVIIIDTREKMITHITYQLKKKHIKYIRQKLNFGDYSFIFNNKTYAEKVVIERKSSLDELAINLTKGRERFKREFIRASDKNAAVFLLIENAKKEDIEKHNYRSRMHSNALMGSLRSWHNKYGIRIFFCQRRNFVNLMLKIFNDMI